MTDAAEEHVLLETTLPETLLRLTNINMEISVHSGQASKVVVFEARKLQQMSNSGAFTAVQGVLLITACSGKGVVMRKVRWHVTDNVDELHPKLCHASTVLA